MPLRESRDESDRARAARLLADSAAAAHNVEHTAREIGRRWGMRVRSERIAHGDSVGNWPGTLDEARKLVDAALEQPVPHEERELLAMLVERGARRAWHSEAEQP